MSVDGINVIFVLVAAWLAALNAYTLYKDKHIRGVYWKSWAFYSGCAIWDIYYYHSVGHPWSTVGAVIMAVATVIWFLLAVYYRNR